MRKVLLGLLIVSLVVFSGCAWLNKYVAPSQVDANGAVIPGTHTATPLADDAANAVPYGGYALSVFLFAWNIVEKIRANKTSTGLKATVLAIEQAAKDPETAEAIKKLKLQLAESHAAWDVMPLIQRILAGIKFKV